MHAFYIGLIYKLNSIQKSDIKSFWTATIKWIDRNIICHFNATQYILMSKEDV